MMLLSWMSSAVVITACSIMNTLWLRHAQATKVANRIEILKKYTLRESDAHSESEMHDPQFQESERERLSAQAWDELGDKHPDFQYVY